MFNRMIVLAIVVLTPPLTRGADVSKRPMGVYTVVAPSTISGTVRDSLNAPIGQVRVTVFDATLSLFRETRSAPDGTYEVGDLPNGTVSVGFAARGFNYVGFQGTTISQDTVINVQLLAETEPGRWVLVGNTEPEFLDASNSGSVLPDGRLFLCHDTQEPVLFDPITATNTYPQSSTSQQGCHISTLLTDGRLVFIGGQGSGDFRDAVKTTKSFDHVTGLWTNLSDMNEYRWYPGMARLAGEKLLVMGGGQPPNAARTKTCEIYDPTTNVWAYTDSLVNAVEYSPALLLKSGEVLTSWYPPQIYSPSAGQWRTTGQLVQPNRFWPGHCDHSILMLEDDRIMICGIYRGNLTNPSMVEFYNQSSEVWTVGPTTEVTRSQPEVVQLPDGRVLCAAGRLEDVNPSIPTSIGYTKLADIFDPVTDTWRPVAELLTFHEYHATTQLVPDGRIITTGGSNLNFTGPTNKNIEAYEPPYLFRGPRPVIDSLSSSNLHLSGTGDLSVSFADSVTKVVLVGVSAATHWVDGGISRYLSLPFVQSGEQIAFGVPSDSNTVPLGYYMLFVLVDDIPSVGRIVSVTRPIGACACPCWADPGGQPGSCDGVYSDIIDVIEVIDVAVRAQSETQDPQCPNSRTDVDANGLTDIIDVVKTINVAFRSQPDFPPTPGAQYAPHPCP